MKIQKLLESYPLATEVVKDWCIKEMLESFNTASEEVPEEFKKMMQEEALTDERLAKIIEAQPRMLFDVFDENEIYIETLIGMGTPVTWQFGINRNSTCFVNYNTRKEVEKQAIVEAFKLLEVKMSPTLKEIEEIITTITPI